MCLPPFAWTNVSSENKNACFAIWAHVGTKFLNLSHHFLSMDAWPSDATFFLWGQPVKIIRKYSSEKRSSPLSFIFVTCALASWSHFFGWWSWTCVSVPFCKDKCLFSKKHVFCNLGARWHKILEFVPSCHICGWLAWRCDFFPVVPTFEDQPQVFNQKGPAPWILFLTPAPRPLEVTFLVGEAEHVCLYPFARTNVFSAKNMYFAIWARVDTKFLNSSHYVLSVDDWPGDATFFLWGQPLKIIRKYSAKKGPAPWILFLTPAPRPLEIAFLVGEAEHVCLIDVISSCMSRLQTSHTTEGPSRSCSRSCLQTSHQHFAAFEVAP